MSYKEAETPPEPAYQRFPKGLEQVETLANQIALSVFQLRLLKLRAAAADQRSKSTR